MCEGLEADGVNTGLIPGLAVGAFKIAGANAGESDVVSVSGAGARATALEAAQIILKSYY